MSEDTQEWENVISNIARVNEILPDVVLVGDTASAIYADHHISKDTDFVIKDLKHKFERL